MSGQFSLKVMPKIKTLLPSILCPFLMSNLMSLFATKIPILSLTRLPESITWG